MNSRAETKREGVGIGEGSGKEKPTGVQEKQGKQAEGI